MKHYLLYRLALWKLPVGIDGINVVSLPFVAALRAFSYSQALPFFFLNRWSWRSSYGAQKCHLGNNRHWMLDYLLVQFANFKLSGWAYNRPKRSRRRTILIKMLQIQLCKNSLFRVFDGTTMFSMFELVRTHRQIYGIVKFFFRD